MDTPNHERLRVMFCKYCGTKISEESLECPKCGRSISYEGGIGFWDMAGNPQSRLDTQKKTPVADEQPNVKDTSRKSEHSQLSTIALVVSLLCIGITVFTFIRSNEKISQLSTDYKKMIASTETSIDERISTYQDQTNLYEGRIASLEGRISDLENPKNNVEVLVTPQDASWNVGSSDPDGEEMALLFRVKGIAIHFEWEKQAEDGSWETVIFEDYYGQKCNFKNGLLLKEDRENGSSAIVPYGLTEEGEGLYRCTVVTIHGKATVNVRITISGSEESSLEEAAHGEIIYGNTSLNEAAQSEHPNNTPDPYLAQSDGSV